jgi:hypothetical protein
VNTQCAGCHTNNTYSGTPLQCFSCHQDDFTRTANPNHQAAGFPQDCSVCHSTSQWPGATFDHSRTQFPLMGAHAPLQCSSCHTGGVFAGLGSSCVSCHLSRYNATANPNHRAAGIPQECQVCHSASAWTPASFDHNQTSFPLTGAHQTVQCANCHLGGRYDGTPSDCYSCHQTEFNGTTDPNHRAAGFPTNCATCHSTARWQGATFTHRFPIYNGPHSGKWNTCGDCHTNSTNYAVFSCINCHEHEKSQTDRDHREVRDYVYNSANCYACHPTGRE